MVTASGIMQPASQPLGKRRLGEALKMTGIEGAAVVDGFDAKRLVPGRMIPGDETGTIGPRLPSVSDRLIVLTRFGLGA
jgi:hypothetical protein